MIHEQFKLTTSQASFALNNVGRIGRGIVALLTFNFLGIGWIADFFRILLGGFRDNVGAPLRQ